MKNRIEELRKERGILQEKKEKTLIRKKVNALEIHKR